jgi:riboflavin kinase/FMN adenylyltransferase
VILIRQLDELPTALQAGAVAIGNFDGVHRGHVQLVTRLNETARRVGGPAVVFTFDPHPVMLLRPELAPPPLTWTERKAELLGELGVDVVVAYPTDHRLLALSPREFFEQIVRERLAARAIVEGPNFCFGAERAGNMALLAQFCQESGLDLEIVEPVVQGDEWVSSSRVRQAIQSGDMSAARRMLTRPYRVRGLVAAGAGRGAGLGVPTANLKEVQTLLPGSGVYAGRAITSDGAWPAAINLGPNPTFADEAQKFEVHLLGYTGSLYGQPLQVDFFHRLREIQTFASPTELRVQMARDLDRVRDIFLDMESEQRA